MSELWTACWYRHGAPVWTKIDIDRGKEGSAVDFRVLDHAISQDRTFPFPLIGKYYLVDAGFTNYQYFLAPYCGMRYHLLEWRGQAIHVDDRGRQHTSALMKDDALAEAQMGHWARGLRRHFGYPYTCDQHYPLSASARHYPNLLEAWGPIKLSGVPAEDQDAAQDNESSNSLRSPVRGGVDHPLSY
ncbi:UNVERIFIED_CONTAM: hypothetical protein Scaly_2912700 [Sesamum calycinum]|uniref:Transposase n=1 Tax=Sesamum calycinum TaxID=2727403 RepID=A0AAW2L480_9LAMI